MRRAGNDYLGLFIRSFLQGLVILGPVSATVWIIWYIVSSVDSIIPYVSDRIPGLVFVLVILSTALIGFVGNKFLLGRVIVDSMDYVLEHTPGIKFIYTSLKDVLGSFVGDKKKFNHPVWVIVNREPDIWRIGFLTQPDLLVLDMPGNVAVYLPHSYAISGWVIVTATENIKPIEGFLPPF